MSRFSSAYRVIGMALLGTAPTATVAMPQSWSESPVVMIAANAGATDLADWTLLADLSLASPVILRGTVERARQLSGKAAEGVPPGEIRMLVEVALSNALKAPGLLPARAEWIWQGPAGTDRRPPIARGNAVLAFLSAPMPGPKPEVAQFRLVAPSGQRPWTAGDEEAVRAILTQAQRDGAPMVTGVSDGFLSEGSVAGASESQFFLATDTGTPLTLVVTRTPDTAPKIRVATGEIIGASAIPVRRHTLLWRALACGLPASLPERLAETTALAEDYRLARATFGPCGKRAFS